MLRLHSPNREHQFQHQQYLKWKSHLVAGLQLWMKKEKPRYVRYKYREMVYEITIHKYANKPYMWVILWDVNRRFRAACEVEVA